MEEIIYIIYEFGLPTLYETFQEAYEHQQNSKDPFCALGFIKEKQE